MSSLIFLRATIRPESFILALYTTPYVPSPIFSSFSKLSILSSRVAIVGWMSLGMSWIKFYRNGRISRGDWKHVFKKTCLKTAWPNSLRIMLTIRYWPMAGGNSCNSRRYPPIRLANDFSRHDHVILVTFTWKCASERSNWTSVVSQDFLVSIIWFNRTPYYALFYLVQK